MTPSDSDLLDFLLITLFRSCNLRMDNTSEFIVNDRSVKWPFTGRAETAKDFVRAAYIRALSLKVGDD